MATVYCELCGEAIERGAVRCVDCGRRTCRECLDADYENVCFECGQVIGGPSGVGPTDDPEDDDDLGFADDDSPLDEDAVSIMIRNGGGFIRPTGRA